MSLFTIFAHEHKDISWDQISRELELLKDSGDSAAKSFIDSSLSIFDSSHEEISTLVWWLHHAVTTGEYVINENDEQCISFRATDVVPFCLNAVRLLDEYTGKSGALWSCEHLLNMFWAHVKLSPMVRKFDTPEQAEGETLTYSFSSFFKHHAIDVLSLEEISWLAHMSLGSVANAAALPQDNPRKLETFKREGRSLVEATTALEWLSKSPAFKTPVIVNKSTREENDEMILVPVARDGSYLNHKCHRSKGYQLGHKGAEFYYCTLTEALDALMKNRKNNIPARWRRPNENGIFGIVTAVRWENRKKAEVFGQ